MHVHDRAPLLDLVDIHVAQTDMPALARPLQSGKSLDAFLERHAGVGRMELIEPDLVDAECAEAAFARFPNVLRRSVSGPLAAGPSQPGLRGNANSIAIRPVPNNRSDQPLVVTEVAVIEAVDIGGVD